MSAVRSARDAVLFVLSDRRIILLITAIYIVVGLLFIRTNYTLNDEGLYTFDAARWAGREFLPVFFFQKMKPVLATLYLPVAGLGFRPFLAMHLAVAALAIPLMAATARALGFALPNLPALIVAFSPGYFLAGAAGLSNSDGVVGATLALCLLSRRRDLLAGIVLGMLPWIRSELAILSAILIICSFLKGDGFRALLGSLCFAVPYLVAGALYHHDALWMLHYPPQGAHPMPHNPAWVDVSVRAVIENLVAVTPLALLAFCFSWGELRPLERTLVIFTALWLFTGTVLPIWRIANFGFLPRYALAVLPSMALQIGRGFESWWSGRKPGRWALAFSCAVTAAWCATKFAHPGDMAPVVLGCAVILFLAWTDRIVAAFVVAALLVLSGPMLPVRTQIPRAEYLPVLSTWLRQHRGEIHGPIYTNSPLLAAYQENSGETSALDVRFLISVDIVYEMTSLSDRKNGQLEAIRRAMQGDFDDTSGVMPDEISPGSIPDGALFALRPDDRRIDMLLPPAIWSSHLQLITEQGGRVLRFQRIAEK